MKPMTGHNEGSAGATLSRRTVFCEVMRQLRLLTVIDGHSRECLTSEDVLERLTQLFIQRRILDYIRSDNGSQFTAKTVRQRLHGLGVKTLYIEPGSPSENGYLESFNGKLRGEFLNVEIEIVAKGSHVGVEVCRLGCR